MNRSTHTNPFRSRDPVGHPQEEESEEEGSSAHAPHRLTTYRPAGTTVPRYVGPIERRRGPVRRFLWALFHPGR